MCLCCHYVTALPWAALLSVALACVFGQKAPPLCGLAFCCAPPVTVTMLSHRAAQCKGVFGVFINFYVLHKKPPPAAPCFLVVFHNAHFTAF